MLMPQPLGSRVILALQIAREVDLALFSSFLYQQSIRHRINEAGDLQELWVADDADAERVRAYYAAFSQGELSLQAGPAARRRSNLLKNLLNAVWRVPMTFGLILLTALLFPVTLGVDDGDVSGWFETLSFLQFSVVGNKVYFVDLPMTLASGEYWRLLTPMFLHFGILHLVFNMLWFWEIGRRIEQVNNGLLMLLLVLVSSLGSNVLQYTMTGPGFFGGMSGVVFGLLGYSLVWSRLLPSRDMGLSNSIYVFMLGFLVFGFSGLFDLLGLGNLANWAHLGGLLAGAGFGLLVVAGVKLRDVGQPR